MEPAREELPTEFALFAARPNPFSEEVAFRFALPVGLVAKLEVFDIQGRRMQTPHEGYLPPGYHTIRWDGRGESGARVAAGTYFYRLTAGSFVARRKVTLAR